MPALALARILQAFFSLYTMTGITLQHWPTLDSPAPFLLYWEIVPGILGLPASV